MTLLEPRPPKLAAVKGFVFVLFHFVLASFILQLWAAVDSQIAIRISGPETRV